MTGRGRHRLAAAAALTIALGALGAPGARAAETTTTFTLAGAGLSISAPESAELSESTLIGVASLSGSLGAVTVTDNRGLLLGEWTATVSSTAFTTGAGGANRSIANAAVAYTSGVPVADGVAVPSGTGGTGLTSVTLDSTRTAASATGVTGSVSVTWDPTVAVTVPADVIAGTYTGTITHSVA